MAGPLFHHIAKNFVSNLLENDLRPNIWQCDKKGGDKYTGCVHEEFASLLHSFVVEMRTLRVHTLYVITKYFWWGVNGPKGKIWG